MDGPRRRLAHRRGRVDARAAQWPHRRRQRRARGAAEAHEGEVAWRIAFGADLVGAPAVFALLAPVPGPRIDASYGTLVLAGLLVGLGTRYGSGCTSGHGVCGLSRLSPRSLAATATFIGTGFATVWLVRHLFAL